jgi:hypothetical protein
MIARKLNLNLSAIAIKNAPGNEAFPTHLVGRGKICDLDITRSIFRTKITTARADATGGSRVHDEWTVVKTTN